MKVTLTDNQLLDQMRDIEKEIFLAENKLRLLNDKLNMTAMQVRADVAGLSEPQVWLAIWQDEKWLEIYGRINDIYAGLVVLKTDYEDFRRRSQYATMVKAASLVQAAASEE